VEARDIVVVEIAREGTLLKMMRTVRGRYIVDR
jgi:hypothetical protein